MGKLCGGIVAALSAVMLIGASSASAAVEVGNNCVAQSTLGSNFAAFQFAKATNDGLPIAAPTAGVLTRWKVVSKYSGEPTEQLKVLRGSGKSLQTVAESSSAIAPPGTNIFETRIPVQAGDRFAAFSPVGSSVLYCPSPNSGDEMGYYPGNPMLGTPNEYTQASNILIALSVAIEPDADGDGYGDETQDKCSRSAALQAVECPLISLSSFGLVKKGSALILASASSAANVSVAGTVAIKGKGGKKSKRAQASATIRVPGGSKPVADGAIVPFTLTFPPTLRSALAALPRSKSLTMTVTTTTTDLAGQASTSTLKLKLKGQKGGAKKG